MTANANEFPVWLGALIPLLICLVLWDAVWKVVGMWKSARNNQLAWFICIAIFNTVGLLPIIYVLWCQKDRNPLGPGASGAETSAAND
jgi:sorbitol-specific phosphotransferase system component IIC